MKPLLPMLAILMVSCMPTARSDDPSGRAQVVAMIESGDIAVGFGETDVPLPPSLRHVSALGEITVRRSAEDLVVVFFELRGINHYTGWVYSSAGKLDADPLGHRLWIIDELGNGWFRIDAG